MAAARASLSTPTSDALFETVCISLRVNKTSIKLLGDHFGDKMQPNEWTSDFFQNFY